MTIVNLRSDTQTRPTDEMRRVMAAAEVGDEQYFLDQTVTELCERVAALLGHEAAVFLPSGTMCNHIGLRLHIRPGGDEVIHSILDVMYAKAPWTVIRRAMHIHPTVSELVPTLLSDLQPMDAVPG